MRLSRLPARLSYRLFSTTRKSDSKPARAVPIAVATVGFLSSGLGGWCYYDYKTQSKMRKMKPWDSREAFIRLGNTVMPGSRVFTVSELGKHDGKKNSSIYFSAGGVVYDVSHSELFKEQSGGYGMWAGRDATLSLARMSLSKQDVGRQDWAAMTEEDKETLNGWMSYFDEKYRRVGILREWFDKETYEVTNMRFLEENKQSQGIVCLDSGVQYRVLKEPARSEASPVVGRRGRARVHYVGSHIDGSVFDATRKDGDNDGRGPAEFSPENLIPGLAEVISNMREGEKREVFIPPTLAYGSSGAGNGIVRPHSTLVFEVEVLKVISSSVETAKVKQERMDFAAAPMPTKNQAGQVFWDGTTLRHCDELNREGWPPQEIEQLKRLLSIDPAMATLCVVQRPPDSNIPVLMYGREFEQAVVKHIKSKQEPTGPAPFLPHDQTVPIRLDKFRSSAKACRDHGIDLRTIRSIDKNMQICLDTCFWGPQDKLWEDARDQGRELSPDELDRVKRSNKECCRRCVDIALAALAAQAGQK